MPGRYVAIWKFEINPEARSQFETIYGSEGAWAQLFRKSPEYRGTEIVQDDERPQTYLTFDYWTSRDALDKFKQAHAEEYAALDRQCERLTASEVFLGHFTEVSS